MSSSDYAHRISLHDSHDMYSVLCDYPGQARTGMDVGNSVNLRGIDAASLSQVLVCGMGGSAIGGDVLRVFSESHGRLPIAVHRGYSLPGYAGAHTLVFVVSYSGNTEESLAAYDEARRRGARIVAITSGGMLLERAEADGVPVAIIPGGLAPRCALGYLFFPLLMIAARLDVLDVQQSELQAVIAVLEQKTRDYAAHDDAANPAIAIAERLRGRLPVLYGAQAALDAVLMRWRCQIEENAKMLAYSNVLPEMNHNEIVGWEQQPDLLRRIAVVVLHDRAELPRIRTRITVTLDIIRPLAGDILEITAEEAQPLARVLGLICLGDWVSYYLAVGSGVDPYPIVNIDRLKAALKE
ncbi:MAG: bifunctional phosphoglucose/phosphomannose isomerase [Bacteroidota bacterium]|jgi:glucose/mannose-6-phosphate isomerase|nr:bifunctional phosphoglucose/phosphomannose isomerase [Bacteroidota bacterium]